MLKKIHFLTLATASISLIGAIWMTGSCSGHIAPEPGAAQIAQPEASEPNAVAEKPEKPMHCPTQDEKSWQGLLDTTWVAYKTKFMSDDASHVVSNNYGGTISEGQSYALQKALWMDDPKTFASVWYWTKKNMQRPHDHLLGWKWGKTSAVSPAKLLETENASDADQDIAYALLQAGTKWKNAEYTRDGLAIVQDLWRLNVRQYNKRYYLLPGTWEAFTANNLITVNPSYFAPYAYREFANYDKANAAGWTQLADDIYDTLNTCSQLSKVGLPPNWCGIPTPPPNVPKPQRKPEGKGLDQFFKDIVVDFMGDKKPANATGDIKNQDYKKRAFTVRYSDVQGADARHFGYDAYRVYWRMGMDAHLSNEAGRKRALNYLTEHRYPLEYWQKNHAFPETFSEDGTPVGKANPGFMAGAALIVNKAVKSEDECQLYNDLLGRDYTDGFWFNDYNDYLHSVIWLHLYALQL